MPSASPLLYRQLIEDQRRESVKKRLTAVLTLLSIMVVLHAPAALAQGVIIT